VAEVAPLSYSQVRTYSECPLRWKFLYIDRIPETPRSYFTFGRTVHAVLEELVEPLVQPVGRRTGGGRAQRTLGEFGGAPAAAPGPLMNAEALRATYDRLWSSEGYQSSEEEERYRQLGWTILSRYRDGLAAVPPTPVAVEPHLQTRWDGIPVHGFVDRIDRIGSGGLEVLDYKTSKEVTEAEVRSSDQLSLYQVLVEANYPGNVETLTLVHLRRQAPIRSARRTGPVLEALYDRVGEVYDGIRTEAYEPRPGRHCGWCEFRSRCPEFRTVPESEAPRLQELADRFARLRREEARLETELRSTARELHEAATELAVHRIPGSSETLLRRKEERWSYPEERVRAELRAAGFAGEVDLKNVHEVRKLLRDPRLTTELRRTLAGLASREVRFFWALESEESTG
jgi:putative RecB family exonuclease